MKTGDGHRSGFIAIIGRPNVGKSTLLNRIAGRKIAIVSEKPQTTRMRIRGVLNRDDAQLVFVDTPGFHKPRSVLGERLNTMVRSAMNEVDAVVFMMDAARGIGGGDAYLAEELGGTTVPVVGALNKVDLVTGDELNAQIEKAKGIYPFAGLIPISATKGLNVQELVETLVKFMPPGPPYFPPGMITDQPLKTAISELIREKVLQLTREEVPHSVAVYVEEVREREEGGLLDVEAVIYVEKESQKGIIVGKGGRTIKEIGTRARPEIEELLDKKVFLDLRVKVEKDWTKKPHFIRKLEYG